MNVTEFLRDRLAEDEESLRLDETSAQQDEGALRRGRAELRAKRAIVELHQGLSDIWGFHGCLTCGNVADTTDGFPCPTIRALAAVYADHPSYDQGWRPR
ncbi:hypothetical protein ATJ97_1454 [Georgenia soli]|uniref:Uncharacterized protein n=1 Tax=Georgenia soli TaxID=638953 RepID=A0A2A9EKA2_9MICO|nr:DUF6221 family protein [Georgenia soli]PFG38961.1 hypothetical protein ATJ97_1454 [Georgenia soli]